MTHDQESPQDWGPDGLGKRLHRDSPVSDTQSTLMSIRTHPLAIVGGVLVVLAAVLYFFFGISGLIPLVLLVVVAGGSRIYLQQLQRRRLDEAALARTHQEEQDRFAKEQRDRRQDIVELRNQRRRATTIFVANQAGDGSKTTTTAYLALTFMKRLRGVPVIIVECRRDSAQGVDKHKIDAARTTSIREFYRHYKLGNFHDTQGNLSTELIMDELILSGGGICYLQADLETPTNDTFGKDEAAEIIRVLKSTGSIIIIDSGNNPTDPITIGMANESALGVFPTLPEAKSITLRRRTINTFKTHVSSSIVEDSITVLNALEPKQSVEKLKAHMGYIDDDGRFFVTVFDPYMKDDPVDTNDAEVSNGTKVASLRAILPENRDEFERMVQELLSIFVQQGQRPHVRSIHQMTERSTN